MTEENLDNAFLLIFQQLIEVKKEQDTLKKELNKILEKLKENESV